MKVYQFINYSDLLNLFSWNANKETKKINAYVNAWGQKKGIKRDQATIFPNRD